MAQTFNEGENGEVIQAKINGAITELNAHVADEENPHSVTKDQVGLGNCDNTADIDKPVSTPQQQALNNLASNIDLLLDAKADLVAGKVPAAQLPSYVDDVEEYANLGAFPASGETSKIYIAIDNNVSYRWTGTQYISISQILGSLAAAAGRIVLTSGTADTITAGDDFTYHSNFLTVAPSTSNVVASFGGIKSAINVGGIGEDKGNAYYGGYFDSGLPKAYIGMNAYYDGSWAHPDTDRTQLLMLLGGDGDFQWYVGTGINNGNRRMRLNASRLYSSVPFTFHSAPDGTNYALSGNDALTNLNGNEVYIRRNNDVRVAILDETITNTRRTMIGSAYDDLPLARLHVLEPTATEAVAMYETGDGDNNPNCKIFQDTVNTTNASKAVLHRVNIPTDTAVLFTAYVVARRSGGGGSADDCAAYQVTGLYKNVGGNATAVGIPSVTVIGESVSTYDVTLTAGGTNVTIEVTGVAATNITWHLAELKVMTVTS